MTTIHERRTRGRGRQESGERSTAQAGSRAVGLVLLLLLGSSVAASGAPGRWPDRERWPEALRHATRSPATWGPAAGALAVAAGGVDRDISEWARRETPIFGSTDGARRWSDQLLAATNLGMIASALTVRPQDAEPARFERLLWDETGVLATAGIVDGLKRVTGRERPNGSSDQSMPSGHSAAASASAAMAVRNLRLAAPSSPALRRGLAAGIDTLTAGTAWARVEAGAHFPSDVLVGAAVGHFVAVLVHDAFLESRQPVVAFELDHDRRAVVVIIHLG